MPDANAAAGEIEADRLPWHLYRALPAMARRIPEVAGYLGDSVDDIAYHDRADVAAIGRLMDDLGEDYAALVEATNPEKALALLGRQCMLTAVRRGPAGSETINAGITDRLARRFDLSPAARWYHGRPVMVMRNDYRSGLYNGDVGIVLRNDEGQLRVWFEGDDGARPFLPSARPAHDAAYAMTIHKSQGSEFDTVTLALPGHDLPALTGELLYTGLTRGRNRLAGYADPGVLAPMMKRRMGRVSALANRCTAPG